MFVKMSGERPQYCSGQQSLDLRSWPSCVLPFVYGMDVLSPHFSGTDVYIRETKHPLHNGMAQYRRANSSGQDSLKPDRRDTPVFDTLCQTGMTVFKQWRWPKILVVTYNAVLSSIPRQLNNHSNLGSPSPTNPHEGRFDQ